MKKILFSVMTLVLVIGLVGAGVIANFSDTETSSGNTFTAGTLDLTGQIAQKVLTGWGTVTLDPVGGGPVNGGNFAFTVSNVAPGSIGLDTWTLTNIGSIAGQLSFTVSAITNNDNLCNEPEALVDSTPGPTGGGELGANLFVELRVDSLPLYSGFLDGMPGAYTGVALAKDASALVTLYWSIDGGVGNIIQSDSVAFNIVFDLVQ